MPMLCASGCHPSLNFLLDPQKYFLAFFLVCCRRFIETKTASNVLCCSVFTLSLYQLVFYGLLCHKIKNNFKKTSIPHPYIFGAAVRSTGIFIGPTATERSWQSDRHQQCRPLYRLLDYTKVIQIIPTRTTSAVV